MFSSQNCLFFAARFVGVMLFGMDTFLDARLTGARLDFGAWLTMAGGLTTPTLGVLGRIGTPFLAARLIGGVGAGGFLASRLALTAGCGTALWPRLGMCGFNLMLCRPVSVGLSQVLVAWCVVPWVSRPALAGAVLVVADEVAELRQVCDAYWLKSLRRH